MPCEKHTVKEWCIVSFCFHGRFVVYASIVLRMLNGTASWGGVVGGNHVQVRKFDSSMGERENLKNSWRHIV